jgi:hypothetical protein
MIFTIGRSMFFRKITLPFRELVPAGVGDTKPSGAGAWPPPPAPPAKKRKSPGTALKIAIAAAATFFGILINTSAYSDLHNTPGFEVNVFWSIYNIAILMLAATVCVELPQRRQHERFHAKEKAVLRCQGHADIVCAVADLSLGGAKIAGPLPPWANERGEGVLILDRGTLAVPFRFVRRPQGGQPAASFRINFDATTPLRRALMAKLFTGSYRSTVDQISVPLVLFAIAKRILR